MKYEVIDILFIFIASSRVSKRTFKILQKCICAAHPSPSQAIQYP